jgi:integrase/recombinase XerD
MAATSPLRHGNQQGSVSPLPARTRRLVRLFEDDLAVRYGPATATGYLRHVRGLLSWLVKRGVALVDVRTPDLAGYQAELLAVRGKAGRPLSAGHQTNVVKAVKAFFRFLYARGYALHDPAARLEYPRGERRLPRTILTPEEARKMLEAPDARTLLGLRDRAILETFYATGIRVGELVRLQPHDVDTRERLLRVVMGKGRRDRNLPLTRAAAAAIDSYSVKARPALAARGRSPVLFLSARGGPLNRWLVNLVVHRAAKKAGVRKPATCHTFRHSMATHLLRGRADIRHIQALLGHASLATTERYTRVEVQDLRAVLARAHPRGR